MSFKPRIFFSARQDSAEKIREFHPLLGQALPRPRRLLLAGALLLRGPDRRAAAAGILPADRTPGNRKFPGPVEPGSRWGSEGGGQTGDGRGERQRSRRDGRGRTPAVGGAHAKLSEEAAGPGASTGESQGEDPDRPFRNLRS